MSFAVLTDTSGNLLNQEIRDYGLHVIPFTYIYDGQDHTCIDTDSFDAEDFYARIKRGLQVTTSQISPQQYMDFFEPYLKAGQDVIYVAMSSGISGSCNSARIGADMLREAYPERIIAVIDTRGAALGEGIIALRAAELRADAVFKGTTVDGVYDSDPRKNPDAKLIRDITYQETIERGLKVMDTSAFQMCLDQHIPCIRIFNMDDLNNILRVARGEDIGTVVHQ